MHVSSVKGQRSTKVKVNPPRRFGHLALQSRAHGQAAICRVCAMFLPLGCVCGCEGEILGRFGVRLSMLREASQTEWLSCFGCS